MTREDIIRMALEAGVRAAKLLDEFGTEGALCDSEIQDLRAAERLAQAAYDAGAAAERNRTWKPEDWTEYERSIAAAEREACAQVCDAQAGRSVASMLKAKSMKNRDIYSAAGQTAQWNAAAIRARGQS